MDDTVFTSQFIERKREVIASTPTPLPYLPNPRPRALSVSHTTSEATAQSPFFCLPAEIRCQIYRHLFNARAIHINLRFGFRPRRDERKHGGVSFGLGGKGIRKWRWNHSVCHGPNDGDLIWNDGCEGGSRSMYCEKVGAKHPKECFVAGISWLFVCKQAYSEAIPVLYNSNVFSLTTPNLIHVLPKLLLPQRLADVRRLALKEYGSQSPEFWDAYNHLFQVLNSSFPNLSWLSIYIVCGTPLDRSREARLPRQPALTPFRNAILGPLEEFLSRRGRQINLEFVVPSSWFVEIAGYSPRENSNGMLFEHLQEPGSGEIIPYRIYGHPGDIQLICTMAG